MPFKRHSVRYSSTPNPTTPYQRAHQVWDDRIGSARVQAKNWRLMAFASLLLTAALSAALIWQISRATVTPYVVEVDPQGAVKGVSPATDTYNPTDAQIAHHLSRFVTNVRSVPLDPVVLRQNWLEAYDYAHDNALATLNEYARSSNPFGEVGRKTIAAEVISVVRASDTSFQLRWAERTYRSGLLISSKRWTALLSIVIQVPRDEHAIRKNPLGIHIVALDWSQELSSTEGDEGETP